MFTDSFMDILCLIFAVGAIGIGIYEIATKKFIGRGDKKVKEEYRVEFATKEGIIYIVVGAAALVMSLILMKGILPVIPFYWICMAVVIGGLVVDAVLAKKYLK